MRNWNIIKKPLTELKPASYNPRTISDRARAGLGTSIERFGLVQPIVWNKRTGNIVGGHQRYDVLVSKGVTETEVVEVDLDDQEEQVLNVALNNPEIQGEWDNDRLEVMLRGIKGESEELFDALRLDDLTKSLRINLEVASSKTTIDAEPRLDEAEELAKKWGVREGQIWKLNQHKIICGSCTDPKVYEALLGEDRAQLAITSPPYGVGKDYEKKGIEPWVSTVKPCIGNLARWADVVVWQLGDLFTTGSQFIEPTQTYSINMFMEVGMRPIWIRIWEKQGMNFGIGPYHLVSNKPVQQYEQIVAVASEDRFKDFDGAEMPDYNWVTAFAKSQYKYVKRLSMTDRREWGYAGIWKINTVHSNDKHPAMFPLELPRRCILMHSDVGRIVLEPFCGSGTTIMACENTGRLGRGIELLPKYLAVSLDRWSRATGQMPELAS